MLEATMWGVLAGIAVAVLREILAAVRSHASERRLTRSDSVEEWRQLYLSSLERADELQRQLTHLWDQQRRIREELTQNDDRTKELERKVNGGTVH